GCQATSALPSAAGYGLLETGRDPHRALRAVVGVPCLPRHRCELLLHAPRPLLGLCGSALRRGDAPLSGLGEALLGLVQPATQFGDPVVALRRPGGGGAAQLGLLLLPSALAVLRRRVALDRGGRVLDPCRSDCRLAVCLLDSLLICRESGLLSRVEDVLEAIVVDEAAQGLEPLGVAA